MAITWAPESRGDGVGVGGLEMTAVWGPRTCQHLISAWQDWDFRPKPAVTAAFPQAWPLGPVNFTISS